MAYVNAPHRSFGLVSALQRMGAAIWHGMLQLGEARGRVNEIEHLQSLSDAELAKRGIKRNQIVQHVFRDTIAF